MYVEIERGEVVKPPINLVTITLSLDEALNLKRFCAHQSTITVQAVMKDYFDEEIIKEVDHLIGDLYDSLYEVH